MAVTDPGSSLEKAARKHGFARIFHGDPTIGGRYSVLSPFGLVPAAAAGIDVRKPDRAALAMVRSCGPDVPPDENPGVQLGLAHGRWPGRGRDKVTISSSPEIADFGAWAEQLIAESTGKEGQGLIPVDGEPLGDTATLWQRSAVHRPPHRRRRRSAQDDELDALEAAGHPVVRIVADIDDHIGQEFFRFEIATAVAGAVIGINPFDQPDVEATKIKTRELTDAFERSGSAAGGEARDLGRRGRSLHRREQCRGVAQGRRDGDLACWLKAHLARAKAGDYVALLAYMERDARISTACRRCGSPSATRSSRDLRRLRAALPALDRAGLQGRPGHGVFLQITADDARISRSRAGASFGVDQGGAGARRFRRADRTRSPGAAGASEGDRSLRRRDSQARSKQRRRRSAEPDGRDEPGHDIREWDRRHATRDDRPRPDGRQHRAPAHEARATPPSSTTRTPTAVAALANEGARAAAGWRISSPSSKSRGPSG